MTGLEILVIGAIMKRLITLLMAAIFTIGVVAPNAVADPSSNFVQIFPQLPGFTSPTSQDLANLAQGMLDPNADSENNPAMLSVFTYFGQFIDHDLTLDTEPSPVDININPRTLSNSRTMKFDLDSVYGGGPSVAPQLYAADRKHFLVQNPNPNGVVDLPRNADGSAILVEGRNDENEIISQIHTTFLLVHNKLIDSGMSFGDAQTTTIRLYQWIVLKEVLPHFVGQATVDGTLNGTIQRFYKPGNPHANKTPVEFSVAAYRFGHSMVRKAYELTNATGKIQVFSGTAPDLRGGRNLPGDRQIDWGNFVPELTKVANVPHVNISRKIDTLISSSLFVLPIPGAEATGSNVLAFRNMTRADAYGMPSGQSVAAEMGIPVIPATDLSNDPAFAQGTPLWFYILAESSRATDGKTLGPVGGRLVADVMVQLLQEDSNSILNNPFTPGAPVTPIPGQFRLADLFVFAGLATL